MLGNLQRQPLGGEPGLGCHGEDRLGETLAGQVGRGDVERQPQRFRPGRGHGQRPASDMPGQLGGMTTAFGDIEQGFRADAAKLRMVPTRESLGADQPITAAGELRLEQDFHLLLPDRGGQFLDSPAAASAIGKTAAFSNNLGDEHPARLADRAAPVSRRAARVANRDEGP